MGWQPSHSSRGRDSYKFKQEPAVGVGVAPSRRRQFNSGWFGLGAWRAKLTYMLPVFADSHGLAAKSFVARAQLLQIQTGVGC